MVLAEYLEKVWEVVGRSALGQVLGTAEARARNGATGAVEEDSRLTALFLWTLQSTNGEGVRDESTDGEDQEPDDDDDVSGPRKLNRKIAQLANGKVSRITVWRAGSEMVIPVTIGELRSNPSGPMAASRACGRNPCYAFLTDSRIGFCSNHCVTGIREPDMLTGMTERDWLTVLEVFDAAQSSRGEPGHDDRKFLEPIHYFTVHSITWRALPRDYGKWNSVWKRFWRLSRSGVFEAFSRCWRNAAKRIT